MKRVLALVEGQTEEAFVGRLLRPYLWDADIDVCPTLLVTRRVPDGPNHKGGAVSWGQAQRDLKLLLQDRNAAAITTMFDYYRLPGDFPGITNRPAGEARERARHVERAMNQRFDDERFHAHLQLHELEALLYADPDLCGDYLDNPKLAAAMREAVAECGSAEEVNDRPNGAPSKRILAAHPTYVKTADGPSILELIGVEAIRDECPHFDAWLTRLENL